MNLPTQPADCAHLKIVFHRQNGDGSIDGRCAGCGDATFPIYDPHFDRFKASEWLHRKLASARRKLLDGVTLRRVREVVCALRGHAYRPVEPHNGSFVHFGCRVCGARIHALRATP